MTDLVARGRSQACWGLERTDGKPHKADADRRRGGEAQPLLRRSMNKAEGRGPEVGRCLPKRGRDDGLEILKRVSRRRAEEKGVVAPVQDQRTPVDVEQGPYQNMTTEGTDEPGPRDPRHPAPAGRPRDRPPAVPGRPGE